MSTTTNINLIFFLSKLVCRHFEHATFCCPLVHICSLYHFYLVPLFQLLKPDVFDFIERHNLHAAVREKVPGCYHELVNDYEFHSVFYLVFIVSWHSKTFVLL